MLRNVVIFFNVYYVLRFGKIILFNVCVNRFFKLVQYLLEIFLGLLEIEKLMDLIEVVNLIEILLIFIKYYKESY